MKLFVIFAGLSLAIAGTLAWACATYLPWWAGPLAFGAWPVIMVIWWIARFQYDQTYQRMYAQAKAGQNAASMQAHSARVENEMLKQAAKSATARMEAEISRLSAVADHHQAETARLNTDLLIVTAQRDDLAAREAHFHRQEKEREGWTRLPQGDLMPDEMLSTAIARALR